MKKYRIALIDFSKGNGKILWTKYAVGIKEARHISPIKCHYSNNAKCFIGWKENLNCVISEV